MDLMKLLDKYKRILLPKINDWSLQYDDKKYRKDWWNMGHIEWFVFHTKAYKWVLFNISLGSFLMFTFLTILFYIRDNMILSVIFLLLGLRMGYASYKKVKTWKIINTTTFYDLLFREYYTK